MPNINPEVLRWARETAGLTLEKAAKSINIKIHRLDGMEKGSIVPTQKQIANMALKYHRSVLVFYLPHPPKQKSIIQDFRKLSTLSTDMQPQLDIMVRDLHVRQNIVIDSLEEMEEDEELEFVGSMNNVKNPDEIADKIVEDINFDISQYRNSKNIDDAFNYLRRIVEISRTYVILMGNLGHYTTSIGIDVFRGMALANKICPFIVINENDSRAAWSFTLLHELAHLYKGASGISGYESEEEIEDLCDEVASKILLEPHEIRDIAVDHLENKNLLLFITEFAERRFISRKMVACCLRKEGKIDWPTYNHIARILDEDRLALKRSSSSGTGGNYYYTRRHRVGNGLNTLVGRMLEYGSINTVRAGRVLGVRSIYVGKMVSI